MTSRACEAAYQTPFFALTMRPNTLKARAKTLFWLGVAEMAEGAVPHGALAQIAAITTAAD